MSKAAEMPSSQRQIAGTNATQVQAQNVTIVNGITEQRAHEIAQSTARDVVTEFYAQGQDLANRRLDQFEIRLIEKLSAKDKLGAFADPGFQALLKRAQLQAAVSGKTSDYELLSQLLAERTSGENRAHHLAVKKAIDSVESLENDTLTGLTVTWYVLSVLHYARTDLMEAFESSLAELLQGGELPSGSSWVDELATLGLVVATTSSVTTFKKIDQLWSGVYPTHFATPIPALEAADLVTKLRSIGLQNLIAKHWLYPEQYMVSFIGRGDAESLITSIGLDDASIPIAREILSSVPQTRDEAVIELFKERVSSNAPTLHKVMDWWDEFSQRGHLRITNAGRVLAHVHANRNGRYDGVTAFVRY